VEIAIAVIGAIFGYVAGVAAERRREKRRLRVAARLMHDALDSAITTLREYGGGEDWTKVGAEFQRACHDWERLRDDLLSSVTTAEAERLLDTMGALEVVSREVEQSPKDKRYRREARRTVTRDLTEGLAASALLLERYRGGRAIRGWPAEPAEAEPIIVRSSRSRPSPLRRSERSDA
jgi:hypothetical protein